MDLFHGVAFTIWTVNVILVVGGSLATVIWTRIRERKAEGTPSFSILKPLKGVDSGLYENLETFLNLDYPQYEVIFSVADDQDPAIAVVRRLLAAYPRAPAHLIIGDDVIAPNPKVNNLARSLDAARHDFIVISDSYIRASDDYLQNLLDVYGPDTGVVTGLRCGYGGKGIGGKLEEYHMNSFYIRSQVQARLAHQTFCLGSTMMFARSLAEQLGGFKVFGHFACEDFAFGMACKRKGKKVSLSHAPVRQFIGQRSFQEFWLRHLRWHILRKYATPWIFFIDWLHRPLPASVLAYLGISGFAPQLALEAVLATNALWFLCDLFVQRAIINTWINPAIWLLKEILAPFNWLHSLIGRHIVWRGNKLKLLTGGRVEAVPKYQTQEQDQSLGKVS